MSKKPTTQTGQQLWQLLPSVYQERDNGDLEISVEANSLTGARVWVVQFETAGEWDYRIVPAALDKIAIPAAERVVVFGVNRLGAASEKIPISAAIQ